MSDLKIIVEGISDKKFLKDFVFVRFDQVLHDDNFIIAKGNSLAMTARANTIQKNTLGGGVNICIFDADSNIGEARTKLEKEIEQYSLVIGDQFFIPNDQDPGNLEVLLRNIVNPSKTGVFNCIDNYADCLAPFNGPEIRILDEKLRVFIYVDSFVVGGSGKPQDIDFTEEVLWDLNSEYLDPLAEFLAPYFPE